DLSATVIAAGLAPTTEAGPANLSDIRFLSDLYALGAAPYMDAVAAKPYGFSTSPDDRTVRDDTLNFSRIVALREIMLQHGDSSKALWASDWGWNSLPSDWSGSPSIWGSVSADQRLSYTLSALERADREWAWLGGMVLREWQPAAPPDDPQWGFALIDPHGNPTPLWSALVDRPQPAAAANGLYFPANDYAQYSGVWTFSALGADIGWVQDSQLDFTYQGNDLALLVREDNYVAYLYASVDGQQANALPRDASGSAILNLTSDTREPETNLVAVARNMGAGEHTLHVTADRGWDRWALAGYAVSSGNLALPYNRQIAVALATAGVSALAALVSILRFDWSPFRRRTSALWQALGSAGQITISVITSLALMIAMLLTWGEAVPSLFRREPVQFGLAILSAGLLYVQPHLVIMLVALVILFIIVYHRLEIGLLLTIFYTPFFLFPVALYKFSFPMSELLVLLTSAAWLLRTLAAWGRRRQSAADFPSALFFSQLNPLDYGVFVWLALGALSLLWAQQTGKAVTELRTLMIEPALFYLIFRIAARDRKVLLRATDTLLLAGFLVAAIGLLQFVRGEAIITAEEGARRLASVYGSPNNVGLFLGRCIPFLLAFVLVGIDRRRRIVSGIMLGVLLIAVLLTQSAGALLIGIPISVIAVLLLTLGRRGVIAIVALAAAGAVAFAVALRSARFARILDFSEGTNFFRLRVWQSALQMILDHPLTGIGLDQFLYAYRGRYILPDAWQEPNLSHPHNFVLDFWLRLGVAGLIAFFWLQAVFWRQSLRLYRTTRRDPLTFALIVGMIGSMVNLLAHGLVDNSVFVNDLVYVFVLLLGLCANLVSLAKQEQS
ncbi:MAG: O-antigen ligase family protein, partial [Chloroflexota bacterium]